MYNVLLVIEKDQIHTNHILCKKLLATDNEESFSYASVMYVRTYVCTLCAYLCLDYVHMGSLLKCFEYRKSALTCVSGVHMCCDCIQMWLDNHGPIYVLQVECSYTYIRSLTVLCLHIVYTYVCRSSMKLTEC